MLSRYDRSLFFKFLTLGKTPLLNSLPGFRLRGRRRDGGATATMPAPFKNPPSPWAGLDWKPPPSTCYLPVIDGHTNPRCTHRPWKRKASDDKQPLRDYETSRFSPATPRDWRAPQGPAAPPPPFLTNRTEGSMLQPDGMASMVDGSLVLPSTPSTHVPTRF